MRGVSRMDPISSAKTSALNWNRAWNDSCTSLACALRGGDSETLNGQAFAVIKSGRPLINPHAGVPSAPVTGQVVGVGHHL